MKIRTLIMATALSATLAPAAHADAIDDTLAKLPSGPISCDQASRYWTNEADYQQKVSQAQTIARFDRRGPQILDALARVDEAATRCGLKGGGAPKPAPAPAAPSPAAPAAPAKPAAPAPAPAAQPVINLAPAGVPSVDVQVPGVAVLTIPDILKMVREALAAILAYFNVRVPGIN